MSGDYPFPSKTVSPAKCNEKPWDLWISEIGHLSPRPDDEVAFAAPAAAESKGGASRRAGGKRGRYRRAGLHRLRHDTMSLHGLFPQADALQAAVCHLCGDIVKCSAAYRHLQRAHPDADALPPPPPPTTTHRTRSRHKKDPPAPSPAELPPHKMETTPAPAPVPPPPRPVLPPLQPELFAEEAVAAPAEVQVCVDGGDLPVVSIQDPEDLPLGETLTDDIFAIMNSEGIQSADDIANSADWKNIIRDIGNLQDLNFSQGADVPVAELYAPAPHTPLATYALSDAELASLQLAAAAPPPPPEPAPPDRPPAKPAAPAARPHSRSKSGKTKFNLREYDPNKHCGVVTADNGKPCTRSLTCKAHALSLRRTVEGRAKPFDTLLAEHRAQREAAAAPAPVPAPAPAPAPPPPLVNTALDLNAFNGLTAEQQVDDIYATLLSVESSGALLPDASGIAALLSRPPPAEPPPPPPPAEEAGRARREGAEEAAAAEVCWYAACPRPLALCTFNARHAGGAVTLGKRYATVRTNIKSSLSRSQKAAGGAGAAYCAPAGKGLRPEVRRLVACGEGGARRSLAALLGGARLNGHAGKAAAHKAALELGFALDPLLADEKC